MPPDITEPLPKPDAAATDATETDSKGIAFDPDVHQHQIDPKGTYSPVRGKQGQFLRRKKRDRLAARMVEHGYPDPFAGATRTGTSTSLPPIHGFLRGYIDLVVEHAGRWYILDYKSNWLGPEPGDYGPETLRAAMREGGYALQSLIYLVALHRYLSVRLPGYEYERHLGGAFCLFVRGIDPTAGMRRGVYFDRPAAECLLALDDCFRDGGA